MSKIDSAKIWSLSYRLLMSVISHVTPDVATLGRHRLRLTPAGRKVMHQGMALLSDAFGERLGRLSAAQQEELRRLLEKMS